MGARYCRQHVDKGTGQVVEDWELVFADDGREANPRSFKFLQMAHAWKVLSQEIWRDRYSFWFHSCISECA
ncbi:hypothetical protein BDR07DRAFT_839195 [Suillus spraguei]|nr:hypothetical protein BDR07DRAFT_839195 [Suillus spraguei]